MLGMSVNFLGGEFGGWGRKFGGSVLGRDRNNGGVGGESVMELVIDGTRQCYQLYHSEPNIGVFSKVGKAEGSLPTTDLYAVGAVV
jgi:hypothetical protein